MKRLLIIHLIFVLNWGFAQDHVSNVVAAQRTDGSRIVDITYDLAVDAVFPSYTILMEVSSDGGATYTPISLACTGAIGPNVFAGSRFIQWDIGDTLYTTIYSGVELDQVKVKVIAEGHEVLEDLPFEMVNVPAGDYTFGQNNEIRNIAYDYQVSKYVITNAQYAEFLIRVLDELYEEGSSPNTGGNVVGWYSGDAYNGPGNYEFYNLGANTSSDNYGIIDWNGSTFVVPEGYGDHPVIEVNWFGALAFARYYGLRLPDKYEWEKAARGNTGYDYPFGNSISLSQANYNVPDDPSGFGGTTPAGFFNGQNYEGFQTTDSPSPYGAYDMAGNVWEWTNSWAADVSNQRHIRGCSWWNQSFECYSWYSSWYGEYPETSTVFRGFRVARTTSQAE